MEEIENVGTKLKKRRNFNTRRKTPQSRRKTPSFLLTELASVLAPPENLPRNRRLPPPISSVKSRRESPSDVKLLRHKKCASSLLAKHKRTPCKTTQICPENRRPPSTLDQRRQRAFSEKKNASMSSSDFTNPANVELLANPDFRREPPPSVDERRRRSRTCSKKRSPFTNQATSSPSSSSCVCSSVTD